MTSYSLSTASPASQGFCPDRTAHLMGVLDAHVQRQHLPGAVALIARRGEIILHDCVGQQDPQAGTPMALDSIFRIYSMTKPVVSVAAMMLVERGQLQLSDPVAKYLPEFADVQVVAHVNGHAVKHRPRHAPTVQDLLRHTAGLTYEILGTDAVQRQYAQARLASRERSNREFSQALAEIPLAFEPGSVWEYSRATDLLGALLEVVAGKSLGELLHALILGPLGMVDTAFEVPAKKLHRLAGAFDKDPDGGMQMPLIDVTRPARMQAGGAGLVSTAADYARFLQCLLHGGVLDGVRILGPQTVKYMTADHLGSIGVHRAGRSGELLPPGHGFGLGFAVRLEDGIAAVPGSKGLYFWGGIAGTSFFVDPVLEMFAVLMIQAPMQRDYYRPLFRTLVYSALLE